MVSLNFVGAGWVVKADCGLKVGSPGDSLASLGLWDANLGDECLHGEQETQWHPKDKGRSRPPGPELGQRLRGSSSHGSSWN